MTHEFSIDPWQHGGTSHFINLIFEGKLDFKSMLQLYKYADLKIKTSAVLIETSFSQFLGCAQTILIKSATPFDGYVFP